MVIQEFN